MMHDRRQLAAVALCAAFLLLWISGCAQREDLREVRIAYLCADSTEGEVFCYATRKVAASDDERLCSLVLQLAMTDPEDETMVSAFPKRTSVRSVNISERGILTVDFSRSYAELTGISRKIADYCTAFTLFALDSLNDIPISGVMILVEGEGDRSVLKPEDVVSSTDYMRLRDYVFHIYFPDRETGTLAADEFTCTLSDAEQPAASIVAILMEGRQSNGTINHVVSDRTEFLGLSIHNRVCYLNFNEDFLNLSIKNGEGFSLKLYSFVNSLCELSYIDRVQFLINGEVTTSSFYENFDTPYTPNPGLVAE